MESESSIPAAARIDDPIPVGPRFGEGLARPHWQGILEMLSSP